MLETPNITTDDVSEIKKLIKSNMIILWNTRYIPPHKNVIQICISHPHYFPIISFWKNKPVKIYKVQGETYHERKIYLATS